MHVVSGQSFAWQEALLLLELMRMWTIYLTAGPLSCHRQHA